MRLTGPPAGRLSSSTGERRTMLKVGEVAKRLGLSISKVYQLVDRREIGHHRMDGAIRISEEQVAEYLEETRQDRGGSIRPSRRPPRPRLKNFSL